MSAATARALQATAKATGAPATSSATPVRELSWDELAERVPLMVATMQAYLDQLAVSSRPGTVEAASRWRCGTSPLT